MSTDKNQSAIAEMRDQLFLDTADGSRLNVVTANLGLIRPRFGLSDDDWRAAARKIALKRKNVLPIFHRVMEICIGPQFGRIGVLSTAALVGDRVLQMEDASDFVQVGTLILDPGLATEETVEFCFRDLETNQIFLQSALQFDHGLLDAASSSLASDIIAGAVSLPLLDSSTFPTAGFPYPIVLGRGTDLEETVLVSANTVATNTLTVSATTNAHPGPTSRFLRRPLLDAAPAGRDFLQLDINDTREFPATGLIAIDRTNASEEFIFYTSNDTDVHILFLEGVLELAHAAAESVELMNTGAAVETVTALQAGVFWRLFETEPKKIQIFVQPGTNALRLQDASWFHGPSITPAPSTTLATAASLGDQRIEITSGTGFPDEAGIVELSTTEETFYTFLQLVSDASTEIDTGGILVGVNAIPVNPDVGDGTADFPKSGQFPTGYRLRLDPGGGSEEIVTVIGNDLINNQFLISGVTTFAHAAGETVELAFDSMNLSKPLAGGHLLGAAVDHLSFPYAGTDLEEGDNRDVSRDFRANYFPGPYVYDLVSRGPSETSSDLVDLLPPATRVAASQIVGRTNLEVEDASLWPGPGQDARIGRDSGFQEDRTITDVTLQASAATDIDVGGILAGVAVIPADPAVGVTLPGTGDFPESDGVNPAGYRIIINQGTGTEEILTVLTNDTTADEFTVSPATVFAHAAGEPIELLNDVITFDVLTKPHAGTDLTTSTLGHLVELLTEEIDLVSGVGFPTTGGSIIINFGKERVNVRSKITTVVSPTIYEFADTSIFPTTDFPYQIVLGEGLAIEELVNVTANDTGLNRLTLTAAPVNTHAVDEYVEFIAGAAEEITYIDRDGVTLEFATGLVLGKHTIGERVMLSPATSTPRSDGFSYPFLMPPDFNICLKNLFDFVRAAGIEIEFISDR